MKHSFGTFEKDQMIETEDGELITVYSHKYGDNSTELHVTMETMITLSTIALNLKDGRKLFRAIGRCLSDMKQAKINE